MARIFIGVAWPYANGDIHFGHVAGAYLPPDIFARFHRALGDEVLMVSGSDMHGTPTLVRAEKEGLPPEDVAHRYHQRNSESLKRLGISYDLFTHTATERHREVVHDIFRRLEAGGFLTLGEMRHPYCPSCRRFRPDRYVEGRCPHCGAPDARGDQCDSCGKLVDPSDLGDIRCKVCGSTPEFRTTRHYFLRLDRMQERIETWFADREERWRPNVLSMTRSWLEEGLRPRAITRDIDYGVPLPVGGGEWEQKRIYVWFEAVIGYLSASKAWSEQIGEPDAWRRWWSDRDARHYYFLGKDNIVFHTIIWPGMLMCYDPDLNLPYDIPANEYLNFGGEKISKSKSRGIDVPWTLVEYLERYPPDVLRYYLSVHMPERHDTDYTWEHLVERNNADLCDTLGNLIHRVVKFSYDKFGSVPEHPGRYTEEDRAMLDRVEHTFQEVTDHLSACRFKPGVEAVMRLAHEGNRYFFRSQPWKWFREDPGRCRDIMHVSFRVVKALAVMLYPYMPTTSTTVLAMIGEPKAPVRWTAALEDVPSRPLTVEPRPLFRKIVLETPSGGLDLRAARIESVEPHPDADKLYVLEVSLGEERRRIVSGIREFYTPEELEGMTIVLVTNLRPSRIRGVKSDGMLLAAEGSRHPCSLIVPADRVEPSTPVTGYESSQQIDIKEFKAFDLKVGVTDGSGTLHVGGDTYRLAPDERFVRAEVVVDLTSKGEPRVLRMGDVPLTTLREAGAGARVL